MKKIILAANWKLNKSPAEARLFFETFLNLLRNNTKLYNLVGKQFEVVFFPSAISLESTSQTLKGTPIKFGGQNIYSESQGAFTGENSAKVIKELNGDYVLIGHSERRQYFQETNFLLNKKIQQAFQAQLAPMYCIGETLEEREGGKTESVLLTQLKEGLQGIKAQTGEPLVIAYEPVWAIGTDKIATTAQVKETHAFIHKTLATMGFSSTAILYGGSVKAANAAELIQIPFVNGFLVGGASLEAQSFFELVANSLKY